MKRIALIFCTAIVMVSCAPTVPQQAAQPTAPELRPQVMTQAHPDRAMGAKDWICLDSLRVSVDQGPPASLTLKDPRCTSVFINGRTSPLIEGRSVLSDLGPLGSASFRHRSRPSSCCHNSEDNRGFPHMPPAPRCGGNMLAHFGSAP